MFNGIQYELSYSITRIKNIKNVTRCRDRLSAKSIETRCSVPLRTGTCYIRDILELFLQGYCALQESQMKMNFTLVVAPPLVYPMMSLLATPTHSARRYGFFSEPPRWRQMPKCGNLKRCESLSFSGVIESLEPSKF